MLVLTSHPPTAPIGRAFVEYRKRIGMSPQRLPLGRSNLSALLSVIPAGIYLDYK